MVLKGFTIHCLLGLVMYVVCICQTSVQGFFSYHAFVQKLSCFESMNPDDFPSYCKYRGVQILLAFVSWPPCSHLKFKASIVYSAVRTVSLEKEIRKVSGRNLENSKLPGTPFLFLADLDPAGRWIIQLPVAIDGSWSGLTSWKDSGCILQTKPKLLKDKTSTKILFKDWFVSLLAVEEQVLPLSWKSQDYGNSPKSWVLFS